MSRRAWLGMTTEELMADWDRLESRRLAVVEARMGRIKAAVAFRRAELDYAEQKARMGLEEDE